MTCIHAGIDHCVETARGHSVGLIPIESPWFFNRPPTLLAKEQIKEIKKNLKKYSVKFNQKDAQR